MVSVVRFDGLLGECAKCTPHGIAIRQGSSSVSFAELNQQVDEFVEEMSAHGISERDVIAVRTDDSIAAAVAIFAISRRGCVFVPLHTQITSSRYDWVANHAGARFVVDTRRGRPELISGASKVTTDVSLNKGDLAYIVYTSGSTGEPKGVSMSHSSVIFLVETISLALGLSEGDTVYNSLPLSFDYGLYQLLMCVGVGATYCHANSQTFLGETISDLKSGEYSLLPVVPTFVALLQRFDRDRNLRIPSVTKITSTAAHLSQQAIEYLQHVFPNAQIYSMYGLSECKRVSILAPFDLNYRMGSVGKPLPGTRVEIIDDQRKFLPAGEPGLLRVYGPHLMRGYWKNPDETVQAIKRKYGDETFLQTADMVSQDEDGYLFFHGRGDQIVNFNGINVSPQEVEKILALIPGVVSVAVGGYPDPIHGEGLRAHIVAQDQSLRREILRALTDCLEPGMRPSDVVFSTELSLSQNGKLMGPGSRRET